MVSLVERKAGSNIPAFIIKIKMNNVNHPNHYGGKDNPYEAIKVIEAWNLNFNLGNVLKYICRLGKKSDNEYIQDLKKALWYLNREISSFSVGCLLINKKYSLGGNWYVPQEYLKKLPDVLDVVLIQTSNSAGDWDGIIFQLLESRVFAIAFSQENNSDGFDVYTGDIIYSFDYNEETIKEDIKKIVTDICKEYE